jgi:hypothetical protein
MNPTQASLHTVALAVALAACGAPPPPVQAGAGEGAPPAATAVPVADDGTPGQAHAIVLQAAGCWFGGLWSDAVGAAPEERRAASEKRCMGLVTRLYGTDDKLRYDQLRLVDGVFVDKLAAQVDALAAKDTAGDAPHKDALGRLLRAVAAAQHEANAAHAAVDPVKLDLRARPPEPETLSKDEVAAAPPLRAHAALEALLKLDAGDLTAEAHAMGVLCAMDRMELARGLPKHLKVYAVSDAFQLVFGVAPPNVPSDVTAKLSPGTWLTYLASVAAAAGHAVPDAAKTAREREPWAWGGVIEGFADKLRADGGRLGSGTLGKVTGAVVKRLDAEWAEIPEIAGRQGVMGDREAKDKAEKANEKKK